MKLIAQFNSSSLIVLSFLINQSLTHYVPNQRLFITIFAQLTQPAYPKLLKS